MRIGQGLDHGYLSNAQVTSLVSEFLQAADLDGRSVLVLIPDGTRTMPMPLMFQILEQELSTRVKALDFLVALGTHSPMTDSELSALVGRKVVDGKTGDSRVVNHTWDRPETFAHLGTISSAEVRSLTGGLMDCEVAVSLNRMILEYDYILICGPVFPHEVAGFSGGVKYFFPGIAGPEMIHFTHWLGALLTSADIIGTPDTPVRRVMNRAVEFLDRPHSLLAPVVTPEGIAGIFCGPTLEAWSAAAELSARRHIVWVAKPYRRVLAKMPSMYHDLWTGAKGMYKAEPAVADGGEVVIYAPGITRISSVHGRLIEEIGYHCRDYFVKQWERFRDVPGGILAHSTHVKGKGSYDAETRVETPRIRVTLATGISREVCEKVNLGYVDPASVREDEFDLVIPRAGEMLYRIRPGR
jgi:nickel-dependent lactate racemase